MKFKTFPVIFDMIKSPQWSGFLGYFLFAGMLSTGYYYNLTFVQLGLEQHIQIIDALAMLFFVAALILASFRRPAYQGTEGYS